MMSRYSRAFPLTRLLVLSVLMGCTEIDSDSLTEPQPPGISAAVNYTTVTLVQEDFEALTLGTLPPPLSSFVGCPSGTIAVSNAASRSGNQSLRYSNICHAPFLAAVHFASCTRWPSSARWILHRRQDSYTYSAFSMHALHPDKEPGTSIQLGPDGGVRVSSDGIAPPNIVVGTYQTGAWTKFETMWDFVGGTYALYIDDSHVGTYPTRIRHALWADHGSNVPVTFYDDDLFLSLDLRGERQSCDPHSTTDTYVVPGTASGTSPIATGFWLKPDLPIEVTATGIVSWVGPGFGASPPSGVNLGPFPFPGMLDPELPQISLLATVGNGPFQFVGSGPTQLTGSGELKFYVNDSYHGDNGGSWTVTVTYECELPGTALGVGDRYHCGPPGSNK